MSINSSGCSVNQISILNVLDAKLDFTLAYKLFKENSLQDFLKDQIKNFEFLRL
jgi:hypothetical protein